MEPEVSLSNSHVPATCPYPQPDQSSPCIPLLNMIHFNNILIFSKCRKTTGSEFTLKPKRNNNYEWTWEYSILSTLIKIIGSQSVHTNKTYKQ
jgi:hypothetical protein